MFELITILFVIALLVAAGIGLRPPACSGCGSRYSATILLPDAVRCAGCWVQIA